MQTQGANSAATIRAENSEWVASSGSQVNLNGAAALGDPNGLPPHCPQCGAAALVVNTTTVQSLTGVAAGSQHPAHVDEVYLVQTDAPSAQFGGTAQTPTGGYNQRLTHGFAVTKRGDTAITAETINTVQGP